MALSLHEASVHETCGHYKDEAFDPEADGWYVVQDSTVCHACAARDRWQKDNKEPEPGQLTWVKDERGPGQLGEE